MAASELGFVHCLIHPVSHLEQLERQCTRIQDVPVETWLILTSIAVFGSALYGASLSLVIPGWHVGGGALLLTLSAGLAWCVFGPVLVLATKKNAYLCAHACLVTMAYGEAVLAIGACLNLLFSSGITHGSPDAATFNLVWVGISNIVMAGALSIQLGALRVPYWKTVLIWVLMLNGSGFLFFLVFKQMLE